jgi:FAD/FMN-containing dehydrogenase
MRSAQGRAGWPEGSEEEHVTGISALPPAKLAAHEAAVARLRDAYAAVPPGVPVRLAKPTSNLFRFRDSARPGSAAERVSLDVSAFARVIHVDAATQTAVVGGMTTYQDLCDATLPHGLMPLVVPQLKTITLGGAVTGLGIESTSLWHGLPHESVIEMQILTGDGSIVIATKDNSHSDLFYGFPNSYGTLGYSLALTIELMPVKPYVHLRHFAFNDPKSCMDAIAEIAAAGSYHGHKADFVDGTAFSTSELYLSVGAFSDKAPWLSDYTGQQVYYKSMQTSREDFLTIKDYIWRWDTDWFWCSRPFGVQNARLRPLWPRKYRRSDVYRKLVAFDQKYGLTAALYAKRHQPQREMVIQDVEIPVERGHDFLEFFATSVRMNPVWLCPLRLRGDRPWTLYPMQPGEVYVNFGFWGAVPLPPGKSDGYYNRMVEEEVSALHGHKSLYSTSFYSEEEFRSRYSGAEYDKLKAEYDGSGRLLGLYDKCVRNR